MSDYIGFEKTFEAALDAVREQNKKQLGILAALMMDFFVQMKPTMEKFYEQGVTDTKVELGDKE